MDDKENIETINNENENINENNSTDNKNNDSNIIKKKMLKVFMIIFGIVLVLIVVLFIISVFFKKDYSFLELENLLKQSAIKFYSENKKELPKTEDHIVFIKSDTLIDAGYMKDFTEYTRKKISCSGNVKVQKKGKDYIYTPKIDCGKYYVTTTLKEKIIKKQGVTTTDDGLYNINNSYVYRGENVNNYLKLDNNLWRIVKINSDNTIVLILNDKLNSSTSWDNRYNAEKKYNSGINDYPRSRIYDNLNIYYKDNSKDSVLSKNDKTKLTTFNACIGKRTQNETSHDNSTECSQILNNQNISLLTAADYMNASLDSNCTNTVSPSCQNYNYLSTRYYWWLATAEEGNSFNIYYVMNGYLKPSQGLEYKSIRPIVYLRDDILYVSGNGTANNPYIVR